MTVEGGLSLSTVDVLGVGDWLAYGWVVGGGGVNLGTAVVEAGNSTSTVVSNT